MRVIGPSSPFDVPAFEQGIAWLRRRYRVTYSPSITDRHRYLAGDDARRRSELEQALDEPGIDAVVAARGGYGAMRILAGIAPGRVAAKPRWLVGFSDLTAVHALWARARVASVHGAMVASLGGADDTARAAWVHLLEGGLPEPLEGLTAIAPGAAEGVLLGGNLALLSAMTGTPLAPPLDGAILFLEDVGEAPYRIDRMLTQLALSGALTRVAGIALGSFHRCPPGPDGACVEDVLRENLGGLGIPVVSGVPAGHHEGALPMLLGVRVRLDAGRRAVTFLHEPVAARPDPA